MGVVVQKSTYPARDDHMIRLPKIFAAYRARVFTFTEARERPHPLGGILSKFTRCKENKQIFNWETKIIKMVRWWAL